VEYLEKKELKWEICKTGELAKEALIPKDIWNKQNTIDKFRSRDVILIAEYLKVHPAIVAGRVRYETGNYRLLSQFIGNGEVRKYFNSNFQD
jgi:HTH-type transcriptional regulator/antitoxin HigA